MVLSLTLALSVAVGAYLIYLIAVVSYYAQPVNFAKVIHRYTGARVQEHAPVWERYTVSFFFRTALGQLLAASPLYKIYYYKRSKMMSKCDRPESAKLIQRFIEHFCIDLDDIEKPLSEYKTLNDFFTRYPRRPRPIDEPEDGTIGICPADCRMAVFNNVNDAHRLLIKGSAFSLEKLLDNKELAKEFEKSHVMNCRLTPHEIHHYYCPANATITSVSTTGRWILDLWRAAESSSVDVLGECVRKVLTLESPEFGKFIMVLIGGSMAASINLVVREGQKLRKGDEIGIFKYGGSDIVVLFQHGRVLFDQDLVATSLQGFEMMVRFGNRFGRAIKHSGEGQ